MDINQEDEDVYNTTQKNRKSKRTQEGERLISPFKGGERKSESSDQGQDNNDAVW